MHFDQKYRIQHYKIVNKDRDLVDLRFNRPQHKYWACIDRQIKNNLAIKGIIVKTRQWGGSTQTGALIFDNLTFMGNKSSRNSKGFILSHEEKSISHLFGMHETFLANYPKELLEPKVKYFSKHSAIEFEVLNSRLGVGTSKNLDSGASTTTHFAHVSEVARFKDAERTMISFVNSIPRQRANTILILESTAQGLGNYFYNRWKDISTAGIGNNRKTMFFHLFVGWWEVEEYTTRFMDYKEKNEFEKSLDDEEKQLVTQYGCNLEQLNWRRYTIFDPDGCAGDTDLFKQEYPANAKEAFLTSGSPRFKIQMPTIDAWYDKEETKQRNKPPKRYVMSEEGEKTESPYGPLYVFEEPEKYSGNDYSRVREYICTVDISSGIEISADGKERDDSVIHIWKRGNMAIDHAGTYKSLTEVAIWVGKIESITLANITYHICAWYNWALLAAERNNEGRPFLSYISKHRSKPYPMNFIYSEEVTDKRTLEKGNFLGFGTSQSTKKAMLNTLAKMIEEDDIEIHSLIVLSQLTTLKINKDLTVSAVKGSKDDAAITTAIACQANMQYRNFKQPKDSMTETDYFAEYINQVKKDSGKLPDKPPNIWKKESTATKFDYAPVVVKAKVT